MGTIEGFSGKINPLQGLEDKLQILEDGNKYNAEKIVSMGESIQINEEKLYQIQVLEDRLNLIDDVRQKSEIKTRQDLEETIFKNAHAIEDLKTKFEDTFANVVSTNITINQTFNDIHNKSEQMLQAIDILRNKHNEDSNLDRQRLDNIVNNINNIMAANITMNENFNSIHIKSEES